MNSLSYFLNNKRAIRTVLKEVKTNYRPYDPGWYLYLKLCKQKKFNDKFKREFIELVYVTLSAWNMNSRGAKLSDFKTFKSSIIKNKNRIIRLARHRIENLSEAEYHDVIKTLENLFYELKLVGINKKGREKPRLVTFSKTMHFFVPNLVTPIDRTYTLRFFYDNTSISTNLPSQFKKFREIFRDTYEFSKKARLYSNLDNSWNQNLPKLMDNLIIGYMKNRRNK